RPNLCIVARTPQQAIGNTRRPARPPGDFSGARGIDRGLEDTGAALNDVGQILYRIELQTLHQPEAIPQRTGQRARTRGRTYERERWQVDTDRSRRGALADDD